MKPATKRKKIKAWAVIVKQNGAICEWPDKTGWLNYRRLSIFRTNWEAKNSRNCGFTPKNLKVVRCEITLTPKKKGRKK